MKNKSILLILAFFIFSSCGFEPIYSSKKKNFNIVEIKVLEKNKINSSIKKNLKGISNDKSTNNYKLIINSNKQRKISSKDKKGNAQILTMTLSVIIQVYEMDSLISSREFSEKFSYSNISNKFDLAQYEKNIEKNLINKIITNITSHIVNIQK